MSLNKGIQHGKEKRKVILVKTRGCTCEGKGRCKRCCEQKAYPHSAQQKIAERQIEEFDGLGELDD